MSFGKDLGQTVFSFLRKEKRKAKRHYVGEICSLSISGTNTDAVLEDISDGGVRFIITVKNNDFVTLNTDDTIEFILNSDNKTSEGIASPVRVSPVDNEIHIGCRLKELTYKYN